MSDVPEFLIGETDVDQYIVDQLARIRRAYPGLTYEGAEAIVLSRLLTEVGLPALDREDAKAFGVSMRHEWDRLTKRTESRR